jgi:surface protein
LFITKGQLAAVITLWDADRASALADYGEINTWDVSNITDMSVLFENNSNFNSDISGWNVSNVTTMQKMFDGASAFNQDISSWDTTLVQDMSLMFAGATSFNNGNNPDGLSSWANNLSAIADMDNMFNGAEAFGTGGATPPTVQGIRSWQIPVGTLSFVNNMFANMSLGSYSYLNALTNGSDTWLVSPAPNSTIGDGATAGTTSTPAVNSSYASNNSYFNAQ